MQVSQLTINLGLNILNNRTEDEILTMLGEKLYQLEAQQSCCNLGAFNQIDKILKAKSLIEDNLDILCWAICYKWKDVTKENFQDNPRLFSDFISVIGDSLRCFPNSPGVAIMIAAWIIVKGVDKLCPS